MPEDSRDSILHNTHDKIVRNELIKLSRSALNMTVIIVQLLCLWIHEEY